MPITKTQNTQKSDEQRQQQAERKKPVSGVSKAAEPQLETLAALQGTLQSGMRIAAPPEETLEAAGVLGNQNVLRLIEEGQMNRTAIEDARTDIEAYNLTAALIGHQSDSVSSIGIGSVE